ncbi:MAG: bifunctional methylenetetrahydrofolate dehydrogenase/methenyltetrahydrofolate cyclohydrolase, partial [Deltaproteobacteria bacterium]|nr:bifunctional methylenetetrahydrofolate dehydrogenase/methenyltetrahydrofolate cyclohydrolase [Deltaproteobacteria bacterium]
MGMIIDGKAIAREVRNQVKGGIDSLKRKRGVVPGLAVVLVGDDPSSHLYIRNKEKACKEVGIESSEHLLPEALSENELISLIHTLNRDKAIHGILVQLPLPAHISTGRILQAISPEKDIDGFHPVSQGQLLLGGEGFKPCTPMGI